MTDQSDCRLLNVAVLGTGLRGSMYADYFLQNPGVGKVVAAADPNKERLNSFSDKHGIVEENRFETYQRFFEQPKTCDAVLVCTMDRMHYEAVMMALEKGYQVFVEKPMSPDPQETLSMARKADETGRVLMVGHVLRYTPFFYKLKSLIETNKIGKIVSIDLIENVGNIHYSHSFVRGNWANTSRSSFMLLSKSCHDIDILHWLVDKPCVQVSSFGSLSHFTEKNAPQGSTSRCTDGCEVERTCPYSARKIYLESDTWHRAITHSSKKVDRLKAIQEGPYGRCVYRCDNDVVDHQVMIMEYEEGITTSFSMVALTKEIERTIKIFGTEGEIRGNMGENQIEVLRWDSDVETIKTKTNGSGHGGGDHLLIEDFVIQVKEGNAGGGRTHAHASAESHLITFAGEEARLSGQVIDMEQFIFELQHK
jgi:predicted dehydrogenase